MFAAMPESSPLFFYLGVVCCLFAPLSIALFFVALGFFLNRRRNRNQNSN
jgi:hypothetical protein